MNEFGTGNIVEVVNVHPSRLTNQCRLQNCMDKSIKLEIFKFDNSPIGRMACCNCIHECDDVYKIWLYESELKLVAKNEEEYENIIENDLVDYFEMIELIEKGEKVKHISWDNGRFIYYDEDRKSIINENDNSNIFYMRGDLKAKVWQRYKGKEKLPKYLEWVKSIPFNDDMKEIYCTREDLDELQCSECPFGTENEGEEKPCFKIENRISKLKEIYEF